MTLQSRRSRRTTTVRRWIPTSALALASALLTSAAAAGDGRANRPIELPPPAENTSLPPVKSGPAQPLDPPRSKTAPPAVVAPGAKPRSLPNIDPGPATSFSATHQAVMHDVIRTNAESFEFTQAQAAEPQPATYGFRASTDPPTRERLFRVLSPEGYLAALEQEYRASGTKGAFFVPLPADVFNAPNSDTLPQIWYQSRKSGRVDAKAPTQRGFMGIHDNAVRQKVGDPPEVAIINESVGSPDMSVRLEIELGSEKSQFGIVFRAGEPRKWVEAVDQIDANTYCYAMFTESHVGLYFHQPGKKDVLIGEASIAPKRSFDAVVTAFGEEIRVVRDGEMVLTTTDKISPAGEWGKYCGMIAGVTEGAPTRADNFWGRRYGGEFAARSWEPSSAMFRGANVHYSPLYFEQVRLERYGQHLGNLFAPWFAHALFFADAAMLPYSLGKSPPWECHNDMCYFKPGDIVPFRVYSPVCDPKGAVLQATIMAVSWSVIP